MAAAVWGAGGALSPLVRRFRLPKRSWDGVELRYEGRDVRARVALPTDPRALER